MYEFNLLSNYKENQRIKFLSIMNSIFFTVALIFISLILMQKSLSHTLPSHFGEHDHEDVEFSRPNISLRNQND